MKESTAKELQQPKIELDPFGVAHGVDDDNVQLLREYSWEYNECVAHDFKQGYDVALRYLAGKWVAV